MYAIAGCVIASLVAALAFRNARSPSANIHARAAYHMDARAHRNTGIVSVAFACAFAIDAVWGRRFGVALLAVYAVIAILYGASFVRGATGEDE